MGEISLLIVYCGKVRLLFWFFIAFASLIIVSWQVITTGAFDVKKTIILPAKVTGILISPEPF